MVQEAEELRQIGERMKGLREACDVTVEEMAEDLEVDVERYKRWEATGAGVPISAVYHMARKFGVEFTEILTTMTWRGACATRSCSRSRSCSIRLMSPQSS